MKHMLKSIISILLLLVSFLGTAQEIKKKDSIASKTERYGVRFGVDLFKLTRSFYDKNTKELNLWAIID